MSTNALTQEDQEARKRSPLTFYQEDPNIPGTVLTVTVKQAWADGIADRKAQAQAAAGLLWSEDSVREIVALKLLPEGVELVVAVLRDQDVEQLRAAITQQLIDCMSVF